MKYRAGQRSHVIRVGDQYEKREPVRVLYLPGRPDQGIVGTRTQLFGIPAISASFGLVMIAGAGISHRLGNRFSTDAELSGSDV